MSKYKIGNVLYNDGKECKVNAGFYMLIPAEKGKIDSNGSLLDSWHFCGVYFKEINEGKYYLKGLMRNCYVISVSRLATKEEIKQLIFEEMTKSKSEFLENHPDLFAMMINEIK